MNCQSALAWCLLRRCTQAATSAIGSGLSGMRRSRRWVERGRVRIRPCRASFRAWACHAIRTVGEATSLRLGQILERVGVIDGGALVGDFHAAPAFRRRDHFLKERSVDNFLPKSEDGVRLVPMPGSALAMSIAMISARQRFLLGRGVQRG